MRLDRFRAALVIVAWLALCTTALAEGYPARPIKVFIPLAAGGGGDVFTRALADELQKALGQPVLVENRPAARRMWARAPARKQHPTDTRSACSRPKR